MREKVSDHLSLLRDRSLMADERLWNYKGDLIISEKKT